MKVGCLFYVRAQHPQRVSLFAEESESEASRVMSEMCSVCVVSSTDEDDYCLGSCCSPAHYHQ